MAETYDEIEKCLSLDSERNILDHDRGGDDFVIGQGRLQLLGRLLYRVVSLRHMVHGLRGGTSAG